MCAVSGLFAPPFCGDDAPDRRIKNDLCARVIPTPLRDDIGRRALTIRFTNSKRRDPSTARACSDKIDEKRRAAEHQKHPDPRGDRLEPGASIAERVKRRILCICYQNALTELFGLDVVSTRAEIGSSRVVATGDKLLTGAISR